MRGRHLHNWELTNPLERAFQERGAITQREVATQIDGRRLFADLLVELSQKRIVVEVELTTKRIANDLIKGMAFGCTELWVVVPNARVARAVRRKLLRLSIRPHGAGVFILTLGQALQRVSKCFPLISGPIPPEIKSQSNTSSKSDQKVNQETEAR